LHAFTQNKHVKHYIKIISLDSMNKDKEIIAIRLKDYFINFSRKDFQLVNIGLGIVVLGLIWVFFTLFNQSKYTPPIYTNTVSQSQTTTIATENTPYRDIPVFADVYHQFINYYAGTIPLYQYPAWIYIGFLILAFSFLLTGIRHSTLPVFLVIVSTFVFFGVSTRTGSILNFEGKNLYHNLLLLVLIIGNIVIAYFHNKEWLKWSNIQQFIVHLASMIVFFGAVYAMKGTDLIFCTASYVFPVVVILFVLFVLLACRSLLHTILYFAVKSEIPQKRWSFGKISLVFLAVWLVPVFAMMALNYAFESKRIYAHWATAILLGYYTLTSGVWLQTEFKKLTFIANTRASFFFLLLGSGIASTALYTYMIATFEDRMLLVMDNFLLISTVIGSVMFFAYIFYNYYPVIQKKYAFFYVLDEPKRLPYFFIYIFMAVFITTTHLSFRQKPFRIAAGCYTTQIADYHYRHASYRLAQLKNAAKQYDAVYFIDAYNFKAAYQSAVIHSDIIDREQKFGGEELLDTLRKTYQWAVEFSKYNDGYPYAYLNMGNLYAVMGKNFHAATLFQEGVQWSKQHKAELATNLATAYQLTKLKDSATHYFKLAHKLEPSNPDMASNLALQYYALNLKKEAKAVFEQTVRKKVNANLVANILYYNLLEKDTVALPKFTLKDTLITKEHVPYLRNYANYAWQLKKPDLITKSWQHQKYDTEVSYDIKYVRCVQEFLKGEYSLAHLFAQDIASAPDLASMNDLHTVGLITYFLNNYSTAASIFEKSANRGLLYDKYLSAAVHAEATNYLLATQKLISLLSDTTFVLDNQLIKNELFLLNPQQDISQIPPVYYFRVALQAGYQNNTNLMNALLDKITFNNPRQYIELSKMFLFREENTRAEKILNNGLAKYPNNPDLLSERIRLHMNNQEKIPAKQAILTLTEKYPNTYQGLLNQARLFALNGQNPEATAKYKELLAAYNYKEEIINELSLLYLQAGDNIEPYNFHFTYIQQNPYNRQMWYQYAYMAKLLERDNDVFYAVQKLIELSPSAEYQEKVAKEFGLKIQKK